MSAYKQKDIDLLTEAYAITKLRDTAPLMTLNELTSRFDSMSESELNYIADSLGNINEAYGLGGIGAGLGGVGRALGKGLGSLGNVGRGIGGAVGKVGQNIGDLYSTGKNVETRQKALDRAAEAAKVLETELTSGRTGVAHKNINSMTLAQIIQELEAQKGTAQKKATAAGETGILGGMGKAFSKAAKPKAAPTPPPLPPTP